MGVHDRDWKLPSNRHFDMYDSDQVGCVYSNNWNSVIYSYTPTSNILLYVLESDVVDMQIRHYLDSYISASAYTHSCSSDHLVESNCFGPTRFKARLGFFFCFWFVFVLFLVEVVVRFGGRVYIQVLCVGKRRWWNEPSLDNIYWCLLKVVNGQSQLTVNIPFYPTRNR